MTSNNAYRKHPGPVRPGVLLALAAALALQAAGAGPVQVDLKRISRQSERQDWCFTSMSWHSGPGGLLDTGVARSHAVLLRTMDASPAWAEAELTVTGRTGNGWKVAGVSLYDDVRNYWHLALVEAPDRMGGGRFVELRLMGDGEWGAELKAGDNARTRSEGTGYGWQLGRNYRLRLESEGGVIRGRVWDAGRRRVADIVYEIPQRQPVSYLPAVVNQGLATEFRKLRHSGAAQASPPVKSAMFTVVQDAGRFWIVPPKGGKTLLIGCVLVKYDGVWCQPLGYAPYHENVKRLFETEKAWADDAAGKLSSWGFNTISHADPGDEVAKRGMAYTVNLRMGQGFSDIASIVPKTFWTGFPDVFDPRFERYCRMVAENHCRPWRGDPNLLGYYIDNELEWFGKDHRPWSLFTGAMRLGPESRAKLAAVGLLRKRHGRIGGFNSAWDVDIRSWEALAGTALALAPGTRTAIDDAEAYVALCAEEYFRISTAAIRRADPGRLVLGARFAWVAPEPAWAAAGRHCDIVSFNCYPRVNMLSGDMPGLRDSLENRHELCARPLLVSEWGFPALDAGLPSTRGAGMRVDDQAQRAYCAARFQEEALSLPFVAGTSWFMWADEPALGVTDSFPENSNYGLVDVRHRPYLRVATALASVHRKSDDIHAGLSYRSTADSLRQGLDAGYGVKAGGPRPSVRMRRGRLEVDNGTVRLALTPGKSAGVDSVFWNGIPMGGYHPLLWQRRQGDGWHKPGRVTGFEIENAAGNGVALSFRAEMVPADTAWCGFSVSFRITLPPAGSFFLAEVTGIASLDRRPWELAGYFHYIPSWLGGNAAGDIPLAPQVPNYWLERGGWFDQALGLHYGALDTGGGRWVFQPYIDSLGHQHPDFMRHLGRKMGPGETLKTDDGPLVIYMGRDDRHKQPWAMAAFQAWRWLRGREEKEKRP